MNQVNLLRDTLKEHLPWHGARLNFLALFLMALIGVRTVDMTNLSLAFRSGAKPESSYKRLQRFFSKFEQFWEFFPEAKVSYICGDREFIGQEWLTCLMIEPSIFYFCF